MGHPALHTAVLGKHIVGANNVRPELLRQAVGLTEKYPVSLLLTSPFSRGTKDSSALSGISSMRGDFSFGSSTEELAAVKLTEESRANHVRPYGVPF